LCLLLVSSDVAGARAATVSPPQAWVLAPDERTTGEWLARAGFAVAPLPRDRSPLGLAGVIVLGAEASDMPEYHAYMQAHADLLPDFVADGGIVVQLAQSAEVEPEPPFLPAALDARRGPDETSEFTGDGFGAHTGFVVQATAPDGLAVLLVGAHGLGEVVLTALPYDLPGEDRTRDPAADRFALDLARRAASLASPP
jgi:hypothetical protein